MLIKNKEEEIEDLQIQFHDFKKIVENKGEKVFYEIYDNQIKNYQKEIYDLNLKLYLSSSQSLQQSQQPSSPNPPSPKFKSLADYFNQE